MKDYRRAYPMFSLCGLNCGLCPIHHMEKGCPGCGGGEGHQSCAIVRCARQRDGVEYCFQCGAFPCERYEGQTDYDSFLSHKNMLNDAEKAKRVGLDAYQAELEEKAAVLRELLRDYNDGRRKTFFCTAVNLLELSDIRWVLAQIADQIPAGAPAKEKAAVAAGLFQAKADERGVSLKLRRKPRDKG